MKRKIDRASDALYFRLNESAIVESEEVRPGIVLDYDVHDNVAGTEILGLSKRVSEDILRQF